MEKVDDQIKKQRRFKGQTPPEPQVALVAIDPHTGEVKALVGGRNYGMSQLNHVAGAAPAGVDLQAVRLCRGASIRRWRAGRRVLTAQHHGGGRAHHLLVRRQALRAQQFQARISTATCTLRYALAHSLNVATVKVAEMVGYDAVVDMANRAGMN